MADEAIKAFGKIDILVNNAGISLMRKITEASTSDWDKLINVNLITGVIYKAFNI